MSAPIHYSAEAGDTWWRQIRDLEGCTVAVLHKYSDPHTVPFEGEPFRVVRACEDAPYKEPNGEEYPTHGVVLQRLDPDTCEPTDDDPITVSRWELRSIYVY